MNRFFEAFANMFRIEDLRKRILFTLAILAVYRLGAFIPTPGVNTSVLSELFQQNRGSVLGIIDLFSGGNFRRLTIFALGIMPYITAAIIMELMVVVWPYLERLQKEGELGRRKITEYTRYLTIILSVVQSLSIAFTLQHQNGPSGTPLVYNPGLAFTLMTVLTLTTGSVFVMWLGEQISDRGVGNGMSLIIFAGIVVGLPQALNDLWTKVTTQQWGPFTGLAMIILLAVMVAVIGFIVFVESGQRRIPVQYSKRVVGQKVVGSQMTYLPLRVNAGGVIPPIFASSLLTFPGTIAMVLGKRYPAVESISKALAWGEPLYTLVYVVLIISFAYFYVGIVINPTDLADNLRKYGGFIPGVRPGRNTAEHVDKVIRRLTLVGGVYLACVCLLPEWMIAGIHLQHLPGAAGLWFDNHMWRFVLQGLNISFYFGGTSLLIVVQVAMDTVQQIEAQLVVRNYDGFMKKARHRVQRAA
jgi:preprotein translocase subunit SecY